MNFKLCKNLSSETVLNMNETYDFVIKPSSWNMVSILSFSKLT